MTGILPDGVLHKKKHGFAVPIGVWLFRDRTLREMAREVLLDDPATR